MKEYVDYMNNISVTAGLHDKIVGRATKKETRPVMVRQIRRYIMPAACAAVLALCLLTIPGLFTGPAGVVVDGPSASIKPGANFEIDSIPSGTNKPENYALTFEQALEDTDFGVFLAASAPSRFTFVSAQKSTIQNDPSLFVLWKSATEESDGSVSWKISISNADEQGHIVYANEREKYDITLYSPKWDETVPEELREYLRNPVFLSGELTTDLLRARAYQADKSLIDESGLQMDFSVLYGDVLLLVNSKGVLPEHLYEMLAELQDLKATINTDN